jgi:hypothetical protein
MQAAPKNRLGASDFASYDVQFEVGFVARMLRGDNGVDYFERQATNLRHRDSAGFSIREPVVGGFKDGNSL